MKSFGWEPAASKSMQFNTCREVFLRGPLMDMWLMVISDRASDKHKITIWRGNFALELTSCIFSPLFQSRSRWISVSPIWITMFYLIETSFKTLRDEKKGFCVLTFLFSVLWASRTPAMRSIQRMLFNVIVWVETNFFSFSPSSPILQDRTTFGVFSRSLFRWLNVEFSCVEIV